MSSRKRRGPFPPPPRHGPRRHARRNVFIIVAALFAIGAAVSGVIRHGRGLLPQRAATVKPNVLLVTIDTLRWDHLGCYGSKDAATPVLDRLAARGARFETAIMHTPLTAPSHASILTGLTPLRHGVRDNGAFVLATTLPSLPVVFQRAGYSTAGFISGFPLDRRFGFANGFATYDDRLPRGTAVDRVSQIERKADLTTRSVLEWVEGRSAKSLGAQKGHEAQPWFLWVHYFDPHAAYEPPPEFLQRFSAHPYDGEIAFVDTQIGRLFDRLEQLGQLAQTIVLVTSDHGESLGEHGEETHGVFVYDATLRVPWILAGPGVRAGEVASVLARGVDVMPTLLDLAGIAIPPGIDGRSLRPAVEGQRMADEPAYLESLMAKRHLGWAPIHGLRDARWKFIQVPQPELYDLSADARESTNRASQENDRARSMARQLQAQLSTARTPSLEQPRDAETSERLRALGYLSGSHAAGPAAAARDPKEGIALINRLERAIATVRADPRKSAGELRAVLAIDPASTLARRQLAVALSALKDHDGVIAQVHALQTSGAATPEDLLLLSESLRIRARAEEAERALDEAARLDPRSPDAALTKARTLMSGPKPEEAAIAYQRALELAPDHPEALVGLGNLALSRGDTRTAESYFQRVLARDPTDVAARTGLGLVRGREGRMADAVVLLEQVVRDAPANPEALAGLAAGLARTGAPAAAIPYFERALAAGLRTPAVLTGLGFARLEAGDRAGALAALRASLAMRPEQPGVEQAIRDLTANAADSRARR